MERNWRRQPNLSDDRLPFSPLPPPIGSSSGEFPSATNLSDVTPGHDHLPEWKAGQAHPNRPAAGQYLAQAAGPISDRVEDAAGEARHDEWALVRVSVGNLRFHARHTAELGTQVWLGTILKILGRQGAWYFVQAPDQYPGWIEAEALSFINRKECDAWMNAEKLMVTELHEPIHEKPDRHAFPASDATFGATVKDLGRAEGWARVELPDGREGFLRQAACMSYERWKKTVKASSSNVERAARSFLGLPYLWGGTSTKAVDCSGLTKLTYFLNGIQLNRDAAHQSTQGSAVDAGLRFENLRKGDLLFFGRGAIPAEAPAGSSRKAATVSGPDAISHVAIYLDNLTYIHASGMVRINSLDPGSKLFDERRLKTFVHARRILSGS